jgi:hypothetical protein
MNGEIGFIAVDLLLVNLIYKTGILSTRESIQDSNIHMVFTITFVEGGRDLNPTPLGHMQYMHENLPACANLNLRIVTAYT